MHDILDNSLLIVGGATKLYLEDQMSSPVTENAEIYMCDGETFRLPSLPRPMFGSSLAWNEGMGFLLYIMKILKKK